jgi:hypothetical protein
LPAVWLILSIDRIRNAPIFALLAVIAIGEMLPNGRFRAWLLENEWLLPSNALGRERRRFASWVAAGTAAAAISGAAVHFGVARLDSRIWPLELLPELAALDREADGDGKIFNQLDFGGMLIFHCPRLKIFIDDRCELFGEAALREYCEAEASRPEAIDRWQSQYNFRAALVRSGSPFDRHLAGRSEWELTKRCQAGALYRLRAGSAHESIRPRTGSGHDLQPRDPL